MITTSTSTSASAQATAEQLVRARRNATALADFPGPIATSFDAAYAVQDAGIALWPDEIAGWKVGRVSPQWQARFDEDRLVGPIFRASILAAVPGELVEFPVFDGGFAAVEAEFVLRLNGDAPATKTTWTADDANRLDLTLHIGIETAGSPIRSINELGPGAIVSDFGNNNGLILGPAIREWRKRPLDSMTSRVSIDGRTVGNGGALSHPGGPLAGLAFALARCARNGRPLKAGDVVSTGATTGIHDITIGQSAQIEFGADGEIRCRAVRARPMIPAIGVRAQATC
jgi:2-keto-4-pentenoate hydratase